MQKYVLLVESGSDFPAELAEKYGVWTVPMHVSFGSETRDDGTFPIEEVYEFFEKTGKLTKTSGCMPEDFTKVYTQIREKHPDAHILHLAYSAVTTCSYQSALTAAEEFSGITSIDTKHVSAGQTLVTLMTARFLEEHPDCSLEEVEAKVRELSAKCRMGFFPGDLAYLHAGGRVSNAAYLGARILHLNPLIELKDGYLKATKKYKGNMRKVAPKHLQEFTADNNLSRDIMAFVYSKGLNDEIRQQMDAMAREMGYKEILWVQTGGVVTTHCGPGGFGVSGFALD